ncbi:MAG: DNA-directed RNA polymerase subunit beta [Alphaproteobacteria bacterium GM202ARS2]|nr:DNA-directed RNA polymerase subunit beta [Alphaproteobacteria bacterium GM202ARS2]
MSKTVLTRQSLRKSFGRLPLIAAMPDLIDMQKQSYDRFLQKGVTKQKRNNKGLQAVFASTFPIEDYARRATLHFISYEFEEPKYDVSECQRRGISYASPLKVHLRLGIYDTEEETGTRKVREFKDQTVYMGEMPVMTDEGTFIVNGTTRVVVSQMHRSPGVFFDHDKGRTHASGKLLYEARIIPYRGSWVDFEFDVKDLIYVRIDRKRKILVSTLLMALDKSVDLEDASKKDAPVHFTQQEILSRFYKTVVWTKKKEGWQIPYDAERYAGVRLIHDLVDARNGTVLVKKGKRLSPVQAKKLVGEGLKNVILPMDAIYGHYLATSLDIPVEPINIDAVLESMKGGTAAKKSNGEDIDIARHILGELATAQKQKKKALEVSAKDVCKKMKKGDSDCLKLCTQVMNRLVPLLAGDSHEVDSNEKDDFVIHYSFGRHFEAGHALDLDDIDAVMTGSKSIAMLDIDGVRVGPWLRNTLAVDKNKTPEDALNELYRVLRPGEPPTPDAARAMLRQMLFEDERYDLSEVGRFKMNERLDMTCPDEKRTLRIEDICKVIETLAALRDGRGDVDDIDNLRNRRVRAVGELLENQYRQGLLRMQRAIRERMGSIGDISGMMPNDLMNAKPVVAAIREFFGSSQLSQFMDQTNPLSEITHKRRVSALGPGGLTRERAGFEVRDVHPTHYGRICPVETPEGPNIGLISSLATYARVNHHGFIETPYRKVDKGRALHDVEYLSADKESRCKVAQSNAEVDEKGRLVGDLIVCREGGELVMCPPHEVDYMDVSPRQLVSVAAALIPFLENDDANRALMGSNMQRQAVPLIVSEAPLVGTGMESVVARDSSAALVARHGGIVDQVDANRIVIRATGESESSPLGVDIYNLRKFQRSNQNTCINQRPLVKRGDRLDKGDIIADGPSTDKGELALGRNLLAAFMPWKGYNFEDSVLISERIVRDDVFTSIHIEEFDVSARDTKLGPEEITRDIPNVSEDALSQLDEVGIVHVGAEVHPGDILVGKVTPKGETPLTPEEKLLRAIFGEKASSVRDTSLRLPPGVSGTVIEVRVFSRAGIDKDDRLVASENSDIRRLVKERDDVRHILERGYRQRMQELLRGQKVSKTVGDLKKGTVLTEEILATLDADLWKKIDVVSEEAMTTIDAVRKDLKEKTARNDKNFGNKEERIHEGDELAPGVLKTIKVFVAVKRKIQPGDKVAGRHGNKGVISKIMPIEDMPYTQDGTPVDIVLNPLGVPSRMNVGQILETHLGWASVGLGKRIAELVTAYQQQGQKQDVQEKSLQTIRSTLESTYTSDALKKAGFTRDKDMVALAQTLEKGIPFATPVFDGAREDDIVSMLKTAGLKSSGQVTLIDGQTGEIFERPVTVGYIYMLKLHHLVDDKIHARSIGTYSLVTQQPLGGKAQFGGQRFGEMEVWALEAYGAAHTLQEMLTIKSDDVAGRTKAYETIVRGSHDFESGVPESFNVLVMELRSLGLNVRLEHGEDDEESNDDDLIFEGYNPPILSAPAPDAQAETPASSESQETEAHSEDDTENNVGDNPKESPKEGDPLTGETS